jgi:purine-nucleoside phosphorylase
VNDTALEEAAAAVSDRLDHPPRVHIVLGSGLGGLVNAMSGAVEIPFSEIPGFPPVTVEGHQGRFLAGRLEGVDVLMQAGRFHYYEGHDAATVAAPVRLGRRLGADTLVVTNAAGGIHAGLQPGSLVLIRDHVNFQFRNPLTGAVRAGEVRFPDMTEAYDAGLRTMALDAARELGVTLSQGVYAGLLGPSFETPAEIQLLARLGIDVVGMSTVPEVIAARASGMRCVGFSLVTNLAAGLSAGPLNHEEVMETGERSAATLQALVRGVLGRIAAAS